MDMAEKARNGIPITHFEIIDCYQEVVQKECYQVWML